MPSTATPNPVTKIIALNRLPNADAQVQSYVQAIQPDINRSIARSYAMRKQKNSSTELTIQFHRSKPGTLTVKAREESIASIVLSDLAQLEPESISPFEADQLQINENQCLVALSRHILPPGLALFGSQTPLSSLDVVLRFRNGKLNSHTLRIDAQD
jgi:hypothetical protein